MEYYFPYEQIRPYQDLFMDGVYSAVSEGKQLLVHAPTGVGKSISVLAPALKLAIEKKKTLFFLTSRNTQHFIVLETLKEIKKKFGLDFVAVDLLGKRHMCNQSGIDMLTSGEFAEYCKSLKEKDGCEYLNYMKQKGKLTPEAKILLEDLKAESPQFVEEFCGVCDKVCPYDMALTMAKKANVIIADYNYALNGWIRKNLLTRLDKGLDDCIFIFDEAHNLPKRARDELSASLSTITLSFAMNEVREFGDKDTVDALDNIKKGLEMFAKNVKGEKVFSMKEFYNLIDGYEELIGSLNYISDAVLEKKKRSYALAIAGFLEHWIGPDDGFVRILKKGVSKTGRSFVKLDYRCLAPELALGEVVNESFAFVGMSGTLNPLGMYVDLLGLKDCRLLEFPCPFPKENRLNIVLPRTTTKYNSRSPMMYKQIAERCADVCNSVEGNVAVFFPSYYLRDEVYNFFMDKSDKTILLEDSYGGNEARKALLKKFEGYKKMGAVLFGVVGGSFAEGIDFPGDLLNGVVVVGLPLAPPDLETKELINYYDRRYAKGWDYGYVIPAIIKAVQSSGRCIRSETDRGVVVFIDERYMWKNYHGCFPKDWNIVVDANPVDKILEFYKK